MSNEEDTDEPTVMATRFQMGVSAPAPGANRPAPNMPVDVRHIGPRDVDDGEETTNNLGAIARRFEAQRFTGQPIAAAEATVPYNPQAFASQPVELPPEPPKQYPFERPPAQQRQYARTPSYAEGAGPYAHQPPPAAPPASATPRYESYSTSPPQRARTPSYVEGVPPRPQLEQRAPLPSSNWSTPHEPPNLGTHPMVQPAPEAPEPRVVYAPVHEEPPREALAVMASAQAAATANPTSAANPRSVPAKPQNKDATTVPPFVVTYLVICGLLTIMGLGILVWLEMHEYF